MKSDLFFQQNIFTLEQLSQCYRDVRDTSDLSLFPNQINGSIIELHCDHGKILGYLYIDIVKNKYYITSVKVNIPEHPTEFLHRFNLFRLKEGSLVGFGNIVTQREKLMVHLMNYVGGEEGVQPLENISAGQELEVMACLKGHKVSLVGYANRPGWSDKGALSFKLYSYPPRQKHWPQGTYPVRLSLNYNSTDTLRDKSFYCAVPLERRILQH